MINFELNQKATADDIATGGTGPDLTPMIDMVFILLIFFLLTSVFVLPAIDVQLPQAETGGETAELELVISIQNDGSVFVNKSEVPIDDLFSYLQTESEERRVEEVFLRADNSLPFGDIVNVLDIARSAGFATISFMVEPE